MASRGDLREVTWTEGDLASGRSDLVQVNSDAIPEMMKEKADRYFLDDERSKNTVNNETWNFFYTSPENLDPIMNLEKIRKKQTV